MNTNIAHLANIIFANNLHNLIKNTLIPAYNKQLTTKYKSRSDLVTNMDITMERLLCKFLLGDQQLVPNAGFWAEEKTRDINIDNEYVWVVDPLDGTNNYAIRLLMYGVSVALMRGNEIVLGFVSIPANDDYYFAVKGAGVWKNGYPIQTNFTEGSSIRLAFFNSSSALLRQRYFLKLIEQFPDMRIFSNWAPTVDCAGMFDGNIGSLICNNTPIYDVAASICIASELGIHFNYWKERTSRYDTITGYMGMFKHSEHKSLDIIKSLYQETYM